MSLCSCKAVSFHPGGDSHCILDAAVLSFSLLHGLLLSKSTRVVCPPVGGCLDSATVGVCTRGFCAEVPAGVSLETAHPGAELAALWSTCLSLIGSCVFPLSFRCMWHPLITRAPLTLNRVDGHTLASLVQTLPQVWLPFILMLHTAFYIRQHLFRTLSIKMYLLLKNTCF